MSQVELMISRDNGRPATVDPDPEVRPKAARRHFTAEYKRRILDEVTACRQPGEIGALLRREGLYSSLVSRWRQQGAHGALAGLAPKRRGPRPDPQAQEIARLRRENERLQAQLLKAETIIEVQKKVSQLLGIPLEPTPLDDQT